MEAIVTAVLLKALLDLIVGSEHRVNAYFKARGKTTDKILGVVATLSILFLSMFVILVAVDIVFGDHVELGRGFLIVVLIIAMMAANAIARVIERLLGRRGEAEPAGPASGLASRITPDPAGSIVVRTTHRYPDHRGGFSG